MKNDYLFFASNAIICINFSGRTIRALDARLKMHKPAIIHIFVFNARKIIFASLEALGTWAQKNHVKVIVHCTSKHEQRYIRRHTRGITKDKWFHTNYYHQKKMTISFAPDCFYIVDMLHKHVLIDKPDVIHSIDYEEKD